MNLPTALGPGVYSASNKNEYQEQIKRMFLGSTAWSVLEDDNLNVICEPIFAKCGVVDIPKQYRPPWPDKGNFYLFICRRRLYLTGNVPIGLHRHVKGRALIFYTQMMCVPHRKHTYRPPLSGTGIALLFCMQMMFVPIRKHTYGPPLSVTGIALLIYS
jgi:hypothetical protein